jgi:ferredoxin/coenzyme F420-reducing hydrogenase delta subunit
MITELFQSGSSPRSGALCKKRAHQQEELSRREFFKLGRGEPKVIPTMNRECCPTPDRCGICATACPAEAIRCRKGDIRIDGRRCVGCGACTVACPKGALLYPGFTPEQVDLEIGRSLERQTEGESGIVAFTCTEKEDSGPFACGKGLVPVNVPCLAIVSPYLVLHALRRGAQGVILVPAAGGCEQNGGHSRILFLRELLAGWSIEPFRVQVSSGAAEEVEGFVEAVKRLPALRLAGMADAPVREKELPLAALIGDMEKALGPSRSTRVGNGTAPFGMVRINGDQCTGCGLCSMDCPTGALTFSPVGEDGSYRILFRHDRCAGCGLCRKSCPEGAVTMERILHVDRLGRPAAILFEDRLSSCRACGASLPPRAMLLHIRARLLAAGDSAWGIDLCPACRVKDGLIPGRAIEDRSKEITL